MDLGAASHDQLLDATQARVKQLILDVDAVPATLRLLDRRFRDTAVPRAAEPAATRRIGGDSSRLILSILREAGEPVSQVSLADANP